MVDRASLKAFVTQAGEYFLEILKQDYASGSTTTTSKARIALRDPNGPWRHGSVYLCGLNTVTEVITFRAAFPDLYILSGGLIEQVGGRALHCLDDYAQPDALASGHHSPGYNVRTRRPLDRGIGPPSDHLPVHSADQFPEVHDGFAFVTPALMPFRASQCRRPIALRAEELRAAGRALILRRFDHRAVCASHPGVNFAGIGPYVTMNPTRELAPRLD